MEKEGLITSEWGTTDNNRRARYYRLTTSGRRALNDEVESWRRFAAGLESVLRTTGRRATTPTRRSAFHWSIS